MDLEGFVSETISEGKIDGFAHPCRHAKPATLATVGVASCLATMMAMGSCWLGARLLLVLLAVLLWSLRCHVRD